MNRNPDQIDCRILDVLQRDGTLTQREVAERVGLSQNACWRRLKQLEAGGVLKGSRAIVDARAFGLDLTVFVMIKTRNHSVDWSERFRRHIEAIRAVVELHRIGGDWDYMLKIVTDGMAGYDRVYRQIITGFELDTVTGYFSMEPIFTDRPLDLSGTGAVDRG